MKLLINKSDLENHFAISFHRTESEMNLFIKEALLFDLKPLICEPFFNDLVSETPQINYTELLQGGEYIYKGSRVFFSGLKTALIYFTYSRYVFKAHQSDTSFGIVQKKNQNSEPLPVSEKRDMQVLYQQEAFEIWRDVKKYLDRNKNNYPLYQDCEKDCNKEKNNSLRINII